MLELGFKNIQYIANHLHPSNPSERGCARRAWRTHTRQVPARGLCLQAAEPVQNQHHQTANHGRPDRSFCEPVGWYVQSPHFDRPHQVPTSMHYPGDTCPGSKHQASFNGIYWAVFGGYCYDFKGICHMPKHHRALSQPKQVKYGKMNKMHITSECHIGSHGSKSARTGQQSSTWPQLGQMPQYVALTASIKDPLQRVKGC